MLLIARVESLHGRVEFEPAYPALLHETARVIDCGGALHGYQSDVTRTWSFGQVGPEPRRAWDAVSRAQTAALAAVRPGAACGAADAAARAVIEDGLSIRRLYPEKAGLFGTLARK